jgi:hypothetical protein
LIKHTSALTQRQGIRPDSISHDPIATKPVKIPAFDGAQGDTIPGEDINHPKHGGSIWVECYSPFSPESCACLPSSSSAPAAHLPAFKPKLVHPPPRTSPLLWARRVLPHFRNPLALRLSASRHWSQSHPIRIKIEFEDHPRRRSR